MPQLYEWDGDEEYVVWDGGLTGLDELLELQHGTSSSAAGVVEVLGRTEIRSATPPMLVSIIILHVHGTHQFLAAAKKDGRIEHDQHCGFTIYKPNPNV